MSAQEKLEVLTRVEQTQWGKRELLAQLQVPKSTYYRWRPVNFKGIKSALPSVPGSPGTGLARQKRPRS